MPWNELRPPPPLPTYLPTTHHSPPPLSGWPCVLVEAAADAAPEQPGSLPLRARRSVVAAARGRDATRVAYQWSSTIGSPRVPYFWCEALIPSHLKDNPSDSTKGRRTFCNSALYHRTGFGSSGAIISSVSTAIPSRRGKSGASGEKTRTEWD